MVVPDRVVEAERLVAAAPLVAGPRVPVDDELRHLFGAPSRDARHPFRHVRVRTRATGFGEALVRHVPDQRVPESEPARHVRVALDELHLGRHVVQAHRKIRRIHLVGERRLQVGDLAPARG